MTRHVLIRLLPLALLFVAAIAWINDVQEGGPYVLRNLVPPAVILLLAVLTLVRGGGTWTGAGWRLPMGTLGYSIPALGLSIPARLFRYLPIYTLVAGGIGFAIGWIIGRNV